MEAIQAHMKRADMFPDQRTQRYIKPCSVVQEWMNTLTFKQQTVVLVALRGFDGVGKGDPSKPLIKALRATTLKNADPSAQDFMHVNLSWGQVVDFLERESHSYPLHWVMHFAHAAEIIGYKHPDVKTREWWNAFYAEVCRVLHVNTESETQLDERLKDGF